MSTVAYTYEFMLNAALFHSDALDFIPHPIIQKDMPREFMVNEFHEFSIPTLLTAYHVISV